MEQLKETLSNSSNAKSETIHTDFDDPEIKNTTEKVS